MVDRFKVTMTNYMPRADGTGFDTHTATDLVGEDILDAYITDAQTRWATVAVDDQPVKVPDAAPYEIPPHLEDTSSSEGN